MITYLISAFLGVVAAPALAIHDAQIAALRGSVGGIDTYICVAVTPGALPSPASRPEHFASTRKRKDPPALVLNSSIVRSRLMQGAVLVAASQCIEPDRDADLVHRGTGKPAVLVAVGQVEVVSPTHVRVVVFSTAGFLTETFTQFDVQRIGTEWRVVSSRILVQA